jgi:hypothetical protein
MKKPFSQQVGADRSVFVTMFEEAIEKGFDGPAFQNEVRQDAVKRRR